MSLDRVYEILGRLGDPQRTITNQVISLVAGRKEALDLIVVLTPINALNFVLIPRLSGIQPFKVKYHIRSSSL